MTSDLGPLFSPPPTREQLRAERFMEFHRANPAVYAELVRRARWARTRGARKLGMRMLYENLRWDVMVQTVRLPGEPKLNDWWAPFYSRLIQAQEADLEGFFEIRTNGEEAAHAS